MTPVEYEPRRRISENERLEAFLTFLFHSFCVQELETL